MIIGITDRSLYPPADYLDKVVGFLSCPDLDGLILREPDLSHEAYEAFLSTVLDRAPHTIHKLIVHTHRDLADKYGIKRLHLPEHLADLAPSLGATYRLSLAFHPSHPSPMPSEAILQALDFLMISPVHRTSCKPDAAPIPRDLLMAYLNLNAPSIVLLGGLDHKKTQALKDLGFDGFAYRSGLETV